jgi:broad specificity phosphatase PhoE
VWLASQPWRPVLVVAHEETLRVASAYFNGLSDAEMLRQHFDNCQILEFNVGNNKKN